MKIALASATVYSSKPARLSGQPNLSQAHARFAAHRFTARDLPLAGALAVALLLGAYAVPNQAQIQQELAVQMGLVSVSAASRDLNPAQVQRLMEMEQALRGTSGIGYYLLRNEWAQKIQEVRNKAIGKARRKWGIRLPMKPDYRYYRGSVEFLYRYDNGEKQLKGIRIADKTGRIVYILDAKGQLREVKALVTRDPFSGKETSEFSPFELSIMIEQRHVDAANAILAEIGDQYDSIEAAKAAAANAPPPPPGAKPPPDPPRQPVMNPPWCHEPWVSC